MARRHSHSGFPSDVEGTDWYSDKLTPNYLKRKPPPLEPMPPVEEVAGANDEPKREAEPSIHMSLMELYNRVTEGS